VDLGQYIELSGFSEKEPGELIIIKKLIGNYVKKVSENVQGFERLVISQIEHGRQFEVKGRLLFDGKEAETEERDTNLFFALDSCLKKLQREAQRV
jgi:hypothetical protein